MYAHLQTEEHLKSFESEKTGRAGGKRFSFTAIREGVYSESFPMYTGFPDLENLPDEVRIPHDGSGPGIAFASVEDLGEATAKLVDAYLNAPESFKYKDQVMLLTGPKVWGLADVVEMLGKVVGKEIRFKQISREEYAAEPRVQAILDSLGPGHVAQRWATSFDAIKKGECAVTSAELGRLLGREPEGFEETVRKLVYR